MISFSKPSTEIMKNRRSVRTYSKKKVDKQAKEILSEVMAELSTDILRFELIDNLNMNDEKISTYGMIKGGDTFLVGILKSKLIQDSNAAMKFGYAFEQIILKATELGLGTCWLSATFNRKNVENLLKLESDESIPIISPLGYADKIRTTEKFVRYLGKANRRMEWKDLFFYGNFDTPLTRREAGAYATALDMLRLSPSTKNMQPWRVMKKGNNFNFYIDNSTLIKIKNVHYNFTYNDMGIAKMHFENIAKEWGLLGEWGYDSSEANGPTNEKNYVFSWIMD